MTLPDNEIAVRWMRTPPDDAPELVRWLEILDDEERAQAGKFKLAPDRAAYIAAHALLRTTLSSLINETAPSSWRFAPDWLDRPQIVPASDIRFSLSHCRRFLACAVSRAFNIGVDIEDLSRPEAQWGEALAFLPVGERAQLEAAQGDLRRDRFFRLWTQREAFAKASGMGMAKAFDAIEFSVGATALHLANNSSGIGTDWQFDGALSKDGFAWAVAVHASDRVTLTLTEHSV